MCSPILSPAWYLHAFTLFLRPNSSLWRSNPTWCMRFSQKGSQITRRQEDSCDSYAPWWNVTRLISTSRVRFRSQSFHGQSVKRTLNYQGKTNFAKKNRTWKVDLSPFRRPAWTRSVTWWRRFELHSNLNHNGDMKPENRLTCDAYDILWHPMTRHNSLGCRAIC